MDFNRGWFGRRPLFYINMALKIVTPAASHPISLTEVKEQLRLPSAYTTEDNALSWFIQAATAVAERETNRALLTQTWKLTLDKFPLNAIICSKSPLISVTSITYIDPDGATQTWDSDEYIVDNQREPWRITPAWGYSFPLTQNRINAVTVTFTSGYASSSVVPANILHGMRLVIGDMYKNRENIVIGRQVNEIPRGAEALFSLERIDDHHTKSYL